MRVDGGQRSGEAERKGRVVPSKKDRKWDGEARSAKEEEIRGNVRERHQKEEERGWTHTYNEAGERKNKNKKKPV